MSQSGGPNSSPLRPNIPGGGMGGGTGSGGPNNGPAGPEDRRNRRRVMIHGLSPIRKPGSGIADSEPDPNTAAAPPAASTAILPFRIGHGYDIHRLEHDVPGGKLVLAGVTISESISPVAHSDGDVILHAVVDAMLGALGLGDIGEAFPDTDPQWKDASSRIFIDDVYDRAWSAGYRLANLDVTVLLERPKIRPMKAEMVANLRKMFGTTANVNIKAATNEKCDAIGRGEAVAAHAVVLLSADTRR